MAVLGKLFEKEGEEGVDVLAGGDCVGHGGAGVGEAGVYGLVEEDDAGVGVPAIGVRDDVKVLVDRGGAKFEEEAGERRATGAAVNPEDDGVIGGIVAGFEEP